MKPKKAKKKSKINIKKVIVLLLVIYLIGAFGFYIINKPIRNIVISGTYLINDAEVIRTADIAHYPGIFRFSTRRIANRINTIDIVDSVNVRRDFRFRLIIEIEEAKMLFYYANNGEVMLSNGQFTPPNNRKPTIPTLINFAPSVALKEFAINLGTLDYGILSLISEIEYSPMVSSEGLTIDDTRFLLYMNDGNHVFTNSARARNLARYPEIFATLEGATGTLYLDSGNNNFIFRDFESERNNEE